MGHQPAQIREDGSGVGVRLRDFEELGTNMFGIDSILRRRADESREDCAAHHDSHREHNK